MECRTLTTRYCKAEWLQRGTQRFWWNKCSWQWSNRNCEKVGACAHYEQPWEKEKKKRVWDLNEEKNNFVWLVYLSWSVGSVSEMFYGPNDGDNNGATTDNVDESKNIFPRRPPSGPWNGLFDDDESNVVNHLKKNKSQARNEKDVSTCKGITIIKICLSLSLRNGLINCHPLPMRATMQKRETPFIKLMVK